MQYSEALEAFLFRISWSPKPHPHLYANAKQSMWKWEKYWCGRVAKKQWTVFVYVANVRWMAECYLFGVCALKRNTFAMLGIRLTGRTPNKPLFARMGYLFEFASVPHASFACRCGPRLTQNWHSKIFFTMKNTLCNSNEKKLVKIFFLIIHFYHEYVI